MDQREIIQRRVRQIQRKVRQHKWDMLWIIHPANRQYLTGFSGSAGWVLIPGRGRAHLITDGRYQEQSRLECPGIDITICEQDPHECFIERLRDKRVRRLAFEDDQVSVRSWRRIQQAHKRLQGVRAEGCVQQARQCKSPQELRYLRRAIRIAEKAFAQVMPRVRAGWREIDIVLALEKAMLGAGAQGLAFPTIVASGPHAALPHARPTSRKLKPGDLVVIDFGCKYQGYHSDLTRTLAVARMTAKQQKIYKIVKKAQKSAKNELISGKIASEADKKARFIFKKAELEHFFVHSLGHGLGLEVHEAPKLSFRSREKLAAGMVVTCEPGVYIPGWGGIRIEDNVLVTPSSAQWLSQSAEELQLVGRQS